MYVYILICIYQLGIDRGTFLGTVQKYIGMDPFSKLFRGRGMLKKLVSSAKIMEKVVKDVVEKRIHTGERKNDILDIMLNAKDPVSGEKLSLQSVGEQLVTFLIAGHETTSGLLSFTWYLLSQNPEIERKVIAEVDHVLGRDMDRTIEWKDVSNLKYLDLVFKESLRLYPTAPAFSKVALRDFKYGKYIIKKGLNFMVNVWGLHRNPKCWENPEVCDPMRFASWKERHPGSYFPFGSGQRSCIGMQFALVEAKIVVAMILRRYRVVCPSSYKLGLTFLLTIKPSNLLMTLQPRDPKENISSEMIDLDAMKEEYNRSLEAETNEKNEHSSAPILSLPPKNENKILSKYPFHIYYGSNMGAASAFASRIYEKCNKLNLNGCLGELDDFVMDSTNIFSKSDCSPSVIIIVTSTYNGNPPDNAKKFHSYIKNIKINSSIFQNIHFAVFGCGNTQWAASYQAMPTFCDENLATYGGNRLLERGYANADGIFEEAFDKWEIELWSKITPNSSVTVDDVNKIEECIYKLTEMKDVDVGRGENLSIGFNDDKTRELQIIQNKEMLKISKSEDIRSTRFIKLQLPLTVSYKAGDHLGIWPVNPTIQVESLCKRLNWNPDMCIIITKRAPSDSRIGSRIGGKPDVRNLGISLDGYDKTVPYPLDSILTLRKLLTSFLDINGPLNRKAVLILSRNSECPPEVKVLSQISSSLSYFKESKISSLKMNILEVLNEYKSIFISPSTLLSILNPLKLRYYSISSSPLLDGANFVDITVGKLTWVDKDSARHQV